MVKGLSGTCRRSHLFHYSIRYSKRQEVRRK
uniref:Uncharacterized protein n=1 Tax=Siphoviridae sp. ctdHi7 TaxID=2825577 RepID=A0A8S5U1X1_9CAUD|nr:MAG TPA: hypothetical protein [Siphoviridae sp. ctdHi7]